MKNRAKILASVVLILTAAGFFLPKVTSWLSDIKMERETVTVRDEHKELPLVQEENLLDILEKAGTMKESAELRNGEYMDEKAAEKRAEELLQLLIRYGLAKDPGQIQCLLTPVLVSELENEGTTRVFWDCVWYSDLREIDFSKIEICFDDETGYMVSFTVYPGWQAEKGDSGETAEQMRGLLNDYYPRYGYSEFQYREIQTGNEFVFTITDDSGKAYEFRFLIMENGQVVFNM